MQNEDPMEYETATGKNEDDMNLNYQEKVTNCLVFFTFESNYYFILQ